MRGLLLLQLIYLCDASKKVLFEPYLTFATSLNNYFNDVIEDTQYEDLFIDDTNSEISSPLKFNRSLFPYGAAYGKRNISGAVNKRFGDFYFDRDYDEPVVRSQPDLDEISLRDMIEMLYAHPLHSSDYSRLTGSVSNKCKSRTRAMGCNRCICIGEKLHVCTSRICTKKPVKPNVQECMVDGIRDVKDHCHDCICSEGRIVCSVSNCPLPPDPSQGVIDIKLSIEKQKDKACVDGEVVVIDKCGNQCFCSDGNLEICTRIKCNDVVQKRECDDGQMVASNNCRKCFCIAGLQFCDTKECSLAPLPWVAAAKYGDLVEWKTAGKDCENAKHGEIIYVDRCTKCLCYDGKTNMCSDDWCPGKSVVKCKTGPVTHKGCSECICVAGHILCDTLKCVPNRLKPSYTPPKNGLGDNRCSVEGEFVTTDRCGNKCLCAGGVLTFCTLMACHEPKKSPYDVNKCKVTAGGSNNTQHSCRECFCLGGREYCDTRCPFNRYKGSIGLRTQAVARKQNPECRDINGIKYIIMDKCGNKCICSYGEITMCTNEKCNDPFCAEHEEGQRVKLRRSCTTCTCRDGLLEDCKNECSEPLIAVREPECDYEHLLTPEGCNMCICLWRQIFCNRRLCPPGPHIKKAIDKLAKSARKVKKGSECVSGQKIEIDECNTCTCSRDRKMFCTRKNCNSAAAVASTEWFSTLRCQPGTWYDPENGSCKMCFCVNDLISYCFLDMCDKKSALSCKSGDSYVLTHGKICHVCDCIRGWWHCSSKSCPYTTFVVARERTFFRNPSTPCSLCYRNKSGKNVCATDVKCARNVLDTLQPRKICRWNNNCIGECTPPKLYGVCHKNKCRCF